MKIVISAGHGKYVQGASGPSPWGLNEVDEARRVVIHTAELMRASGVDTLTFFDDVSRTQNENLKRIVDYHNAQGSHDLDVSVHFNANVTTSTPMGSECLYITQQDLSSKVAAALAAALELPNRGPKYRDGLYFLNNTREPAILIEVCFVDSSADAEHYRTNFEAACRAIATTISGQQVPVPPPEHTLFHTTGRCSWFGGPADTGVSPSEGLAFLYSVADAPHLFLPEQPPGTTGLARRLNPGLFYVACRWDYAVTPKSMLANPMQQALVSVGNKSFLAWPADWGPNENTGRVADLSPSLLASLGLTTDADVSVVYPAPVDTSV